MTKAASENRSERESRNKRERMQRRGVQRCCKRRNSIAHVPYAQIVVFPTTDKARNRPFVRQLTEPCDTCYTPWMRILVPCDERSSRPEINVSVCHTGYNKGRGAAESDAQRALQNAVASKNSFAARTSQHVTAFHHFVTDSPKFGCTLISTERVELCREHVSWLQTKGEIPRKSTREQDGYLHGHAKQKCRRRKHKNGLPCCVICGVFASRCLYVLFVHLGGVGPAQERENEGCPIVVTAHSNEMTSRATPAEGHDAALYGGI